MSEPTLDAKNFTMTRDEAINLIISSIALEEIGLSHIINSEGEKLQFALGTLDGVAKLPEPISIDELLAVNKSVRMTLEGTMKNQLLLGNKLQTALTSPTMQGPPGPPGPAGPEGPEGEMGPMGPMGPCGPQGPQGEDGERGEQGIQGIAGTVGTIKGSFESLEALREAYPDGGQVGYFFYIYPDLYVWDDEEDDWLNVGHIAGAQGIQGIQGMRGEQGPEGPQGPAGTLEQGQQLFRVLANGDNKVVIYEGDLEFKSDTLNITVEDGPIVKVENPYRAATIIPYNSGDVFTLTTSVSGTPFRRIIMGRGNTNPLTATSTQLNTSGVFDLAFPMPVRGKVTAMSVYFTLVTNTLVSWPGAETEVIAQLYLSPYPSTNMFTPIAGTEISFSIPFNIVAGTVYQSRKDLDIPLQPQDRLLLVLHSNTAPSYAAGSTISGRFSASLRIEEIL